ncbi:uncharacterized protein PG986_003912 [Apiospora aurea]|uniref:Uncharacterized protein n=1 Tax=Apiospora aurea TaxID=335848 RepID=A0ABR1QL32_9PEZI
MPLARSRCKLTTWTGAGGGCLAAIGTTSCRASPGGPHGSWAFSTPPTSKFLFDSLPRKRCPAVSPGMAAFPLFPWSSADRLAGRAPTQTSGQKNKVDPPPLPKRRPIYYETTNPPLARTVKSAFIDRITSPGTGSPAGPIPSQRMSRDVEKGVSPPWRWGSKPGNASRFGKCHDSGYFAVITARHCAAALGIQTQTAPNLSIKDAKSPRLSTLTSIIVVTLQTIASISPKLSQPTRSLPNPNTTAMQFSVNAFLAALAMASFASAIPQGNGLCIAKGSAACSGEFPKECSTASGTGVIFTSCCLATVAC